MLCSSTTAQSKYVQRRRSKILIHSMSVSVGSVTVSSSCVSAARLVTSPDLHIATDEWCKRLCENGYDSAGHDYLSCELTRTEFWVTTKFLSIDTPATRHGKNDMYTFSARKADLARRLRKEGQGMGQICPSCLPVAAVAPDDPLHWQYQ